MSAADEPWYLRLESAELGEAIERYIELWSMEPVIPERLTALGVTPEDFDAMFRSFADGIQKMGFEGGSRDRHLLLLGFGVGRALGIIQATAPPRSGR